MEEKTSNKNNRILLIALTALLFLLIGYTFYMSKDHKEAVKYLQDEKEADYCEFNCNGRKI